MAMFLASAISWFVPFSCDNSCIIFLIAGRASFFIFLRLRMMPAYSHIRFWICFFVDLAVEVSFVSFGWVMRSDFGFFCGFSFLAIWLLKIRASRREFEARRFAP